MKHGMKKYHQQLRVSLQVQRTRFVAFQFYNIVAFFTHTKDSITGDYAVGMCEPWHWIYSFMTKCIWEKKATTTKIHAIHQIRWELCMRVVPISFDSNQDKNWKIRIKCTNTEWFWINCIFCLFVCCFFMWECPLIANWDDISLFEITLSWCHFGMEVVVSIIGFSSHKMTIKTGVVAQHNQN